MQHTASANLTSADRPNKVGKLFKCTATSEDQHQKVANCLMKPPKQSKTKRTEAQKLAKSVRRLKRMVGTSDSRPWKACARIWTSVHLLGAVRSGKLWTKAWTRRQAREKTSTPCAMRQQGIHVEHDNAAHPQPPG